MHSPAAPARPVGWEELISLDDRALLDQCSVDLYRASGPGGQKRNKTSSAVRLRHHPTGLSVTATERRSQHLNRAKALRRLRRAIALHARSTTRRPEHGPSDRLLEALVVNGAIPSPRRDENYLPIVAELLDLLELRDLQVSETARKLGISTGKLVRLMASDRSLWQRVNEMRVANRLKPLRSGN